MVPKRATPSHWDRCGLRVNVATASKNIDKGAADSMHVTKYCAGPERTFLKLSTITKVSQNAKSANPANIMRTQCAFQPCAA